LPLLPFQHPNWLSKPVGEETTSPGLEPYELDESAEEILESIEGRDEERDEKRTDVWGDGTREWSGWGSVKRKWTAPDEKGDLGRGLDSDEGSGRGKKKRKCKA
jgi:hypothetical protein